MKRDEIYERLARLRDEMEGEAEAPLLDIQNDMLYDVAISLGLSEGEANALANGEGPMLTHSNSDRDESTERSHAYDFDRSGLGVGGAGRHNLAAEATELIARGEMIVVERQRRGPMPDGQLWEPCPECGQEPVCVNCGFCVDHCIC